jgi:hypothetical protein
VIKVIYLHRYDATSDGSLPIEVHCRLPIADCQFANLCGAFAFMENLLGPTRIANPRCCYQNAKCQTPNAQRPTPIGNWQSAIGNGYNFPHRKPSSSIPSSAGQEP